MGPGEESNMGWTKESKGGMQTTFCGIYIPLFHFVVRYIYSWYLYMLTHVLYTALQLYEKCNTIVYKIISVFNEV